MTVTKEEEKLSKIEIFKKGWTDLWCEVVGEVKTGFSHKRCKGLGEVCAIIIVFLVGVIIIGSLLAWVFSSTIPLWFLGIIWVVVSFVALSVAIFGHY